MTLPRTAGEVLAEHVTLEVECIDRMYLNLYQPRLQRIKFCTYFPYTTPRSVSTATSWPNDRPRTPGSPSPRSTTGSRNAKTKDQGRLQKSRATAAFVLKVIGAGTSTPEASG